MKKPLQLKQVLAALLTIAALASGLTAQATVQTGIMMQGLARTVNNQTMCTLSPLRLVQATHSVTLE